MVPSTAWPRPQSSRAVRERFPSRFRARASAVRRKARERERCTPRGDARPGLGGEAKTRREVCWTYKQTEFEKLEELCTYSSSCTALLQGIRMGSNSSDSDGEHGPLSWIVFPGLPGGGSYTNRKKEASGRRRLICRRCLGDYVHPLSKVRQL